MTTFNRNAATAISRRRVADQREQRDIAARALIAAAKAALAQLDKLSTDDTMAATVAGNALDAAIIAAEAAFALPEAQR